MVEIWLGSAESAQICSHTWHTNIIVVLLTKLRDRCHGIVYYTQQIQQIHQDFYQGIQNSVWVSGFA